MNHFHPNCQINKEGRIVRGQQSLVRHARTLGHVALICKTDPQWKPEAPQPKAVPHLSFCLVRLITQAVLEAMVWSLLWCPCSADWTARDKGDGNMDTKRHFGWDPAWSFTFKDWQSDTACHILTGNSPFLPWALQGITDISPAVLFTAIFS